MSQILWTRQAEHQLRHICRLYAQQGNNSGFILDQVQMLCQRLATGGPDHPIPSLMTYSQASFDRYRLIYRRHHSDIIIYTVQSPSYHITAPKHRQAD